MFDQPDQVFRQRVVIAALVPDLAAATGRMDAFAGAWWHTGTWRGRPVRVGISPHERSWQRLHSVIFSASIGDRPVALTIDGMNVVHVSRSEAERVRTGDPEFDALYQVFGAPAEVIAAALDAPTRRWVLDHAKSGIATRDGGGWINVCPPLFPSTTIAGVGVELASSSEVMSAERVAYWLDATLALADRLTAAFDQRFDAIARAHGHAAAHAWAEAVRGAERRRLERSKLRRFVLLAAILLVLVVMPIACLLGWQILSALGRAS